MVNILHVRPRAGETEQLGMSKVRSRRFRGPVITTAQMFRALSLGAVFALALAWTLRETPAGAAQAPAVQILAI
jgi:hypothetical protein